MRYVIAVCLLTGLIVWDGTSNNNRLMYGSIYELKRVTGMLGVK